MRHLKDWRERNPSKGDCVKHRAHGLQETQAVVANHKVRSRVLMVSHQILTAQPKSQEVHRVVTADLHRCMWIVEVEKHPALHKTGEAWLLLIELCSMTCLVTSLLHSSLQCVLKLTASISTKGL